MTALAPLESRHPRLGQSLWWLWVMRPRCLHAHAAPAGVLVCPAGRPGGVSLCVTMGACGMRDVQGEGRGVCGACDGGGRHEVREVAGGGGHCSAAGQSIRRTQGCAIGTTSRVFCGGPSWGTQRDAVSRHRPVGAMASPRVCLALVPHKALFYGPSVSRSATDTCRGRGVVAMGHKPTPSLWGGRREGRVSVRDPDSAHAPPGRRRWSGVSPAHSSPPPPIRPAPPPPTPYRPVPQTDEEVP